MGHWPNRVDYQNAQRDQRHPSGTRSHYPGKCWRFSCGHRDRFAPNVRLELRGSVTSSHDTAVRHERCRAPLQDQAAMASQKLLSPLASK
jgi:hypothetical protein